MFECLMAAANWLGPAFFSLVALRLCLRTLQVDLGTGANLEKSMCVCMFAWMYVCNVT